MPGHRIEECQNEAPAAQQAPYLVPAAPRICHSTDVIHPCKL